MHRLLALSMLLAAGTAHAQYAHAQYVAPYAPYPYAYPQAPIYIPTPGHPASDAPDGPPTYPPPPYGHGEPTQPFGAPTQPYGKPDGDVPRSPQPYASRRITVSAPPASPGSLAHQLLAPQNAVRARVGEAPLRWSDHLAQVAHRWADHLIATGQFEHHLGDRYGENLYEMKGGTASPRQVVAAWADEARNYDIRTNACSGVCGHYTQIVWRTTRSVGCAVASDAYRQVWVCEYDPPGNWVGYRPY